MADPTAPDGPVAVAGAGSIGVAFAVTFARAGRPVRCWDPMPAALERARADLADRLSRLDEHGLLDEPVDDVAARVTFGCSLTAAVDGVVLVQECAPEQVELKRELFAAVAELAPTHSVLASSTSAIPPSVLAEAVPAAAARLLVGHPGNPPYLLPVIEVVGSPSTSPAVLDRARAVYRSAGLTPVTLRREVEGFLFNRLQGALLREAYCLLRDGVADVADIDAVVRLGLGRRWGVIGPFETVDLNTRGGLAAHAERMGPAYYRMGAERGQDDPWTPDLVAEAVAQRRALLPLDEWEQRVAWRDEQLMHLAAGSRRVAS
jgi:3-hydroxyacyl-CoA dehydrogenase